MKEISSLLFSVETISQQTYNVATMSLQLRCSDVVTTFQRRCVFDGILSSATFIFSKLTLNRHFDCLPGHPLYFLSTSNIGIKHGFSYINIRQVPWEVLKTEAEGRGFQHLPRDLVNVNALKNHVRSLLLHKIWKHLLYFALFLALFCYAFSPMSRERNFHRLCTF